jgi:hypothetical protein
VTPPGGDLKDVSLQDRSWGICHGSSAFTPLHLHSGEAACSGHLARVGMEVVHGRPDQQHQHPPPTERPFLAGHELSWVPASVI